MFFPLMVAATRARLCLLIAGLAWLVGLQVPGLVRLLIVALVLVALVFDGVIDQDYARTAAASHRQNTPRWKEEAR